MKYRLTGIAIIFILAANVIYAQVLTLSTGEILAKLEDDVVIADDPELDISIGEFFKKSTSLKEREKIVLALERYAIWHTPRKSGKGDIESVMIARKYLKENDVQPEAKGRWDFQRSINELVETNRKLEEKAILFDNTWKHVKIAIVGLIFLPYLVFVSLGIENILLVLTGLLGVIMVFGSAWFVITFGAVPARLMRMAINLSFWMFLAFVLSLEATAVVLCIALPLLTPVLAVVFFGAYIASVKYDTADSLKLGLEPAQFQLARYGTKYFRRELKKK